MLAGNDKLKEKYNITNSHKKFRNMANLVCLIIEINIF